jgi:hypothetical protein
MQAVDVDGMCVAAVFQLGRECAGRGRVTRSYVSGEDEDAARCRPFGDWGIKGGRD